jgi:toxin ParE1/3/4
LAIVRYAKRAEADLIGIASFTARTWGAAQVDAYLTMLEECCGSLGVNPLLGRACDEVRPGLRRMEVGRHVVFYRVRTKSILVVRVLHRAMLPGQWNMGEGKS